ncbi:MAG TPA: hypoxanthine-guanine phosphoribosyltransferase [Methylophaga aminisulfidivorans]|uniref:Hypoxanthine-guanine phosphoribosyltransferase n=1 Tax=Methylophaga aminisulfidivorans TaxID=230105 RepID=A0A7C1VSE6_9GAMM|nr:hypoxanthine-guanine phosphoribosyltransferase [Methylophaga aminisulfidivorans]
MTDYEQLLLHADLLFDHQQINTALEDIADKLKQDYADKKPLLVCVMNGSVITAGHLLPKLNFALEQDYIHATRYGDQTVGGELQWRAKPNAELSGRHVILIEDIFDEGVTLAALREYCHAAGAVSVSCVCLFNKQHNNKIGTHPEYIGLEVPNRYVFGFGMDVEGLWRNLPAVYAMKES